MTNSDKIRNEAARLIIRRLDDQSPVVIVVEQGVVMGVFSNHEHIPVVVVDVCSDCDPVIETAKWERDSPIPARTISPLCDLDDETGEAVYHA